MRAEANLWMAQAKSDLVAAKKNITIEEYNVAVFLMQQSVEKALKALYFIKKEDNPGLTHSLIHLAKETDVPKKYYTFLRNLMMQFTATRYPDAALGLPSELYDLQFANDILEQVEDLFVWITENSI